MVKIPVLVAVHMKQKSLLFVICSLENQFLFFIVNYLQSLLV